MNLLSLIPAAWKERIRRRAGVPTLRSRLENLRQAGFAPCHVIDAGAFRGDWTEVARQVFPEADFLLIEAQPELAVPLKERCARWKSARAVIAVLGRDQGEAAFLLEETNSRLVSQDHVARPGQRVVPVKVERLDTIARAEGFPSCELLKLDLQGAELDALEGAGSFFGQTEVILTEASWLPIGDPPLVAEVIQAFAARGYRLYDVFGFNYRPLDGALWQTDLIFVREDSPLLASSAWS